jgi:hypothetical protein
MTAKRYFLPFLLAAALLAGCDDKKTDQPKADAQKAADQAKTAASDAGKSANDAAKSAADATKAAADKAADAAKNTTDATKAAAGNAADTAKTAAGNATDAAKTAAAGAADATRTQANEWMSKLEDAIKNNKLDEASTYLDKLQAARASLPVEWQAKLDTLKQTYEAAKAKATLNK